MSRIRVLACILFGLTALLGPAAVGAQHVDCSLGPPEDAGPYAGDHPEVLEGTFRLVLTGTSRDSTWTRASELTLRVATAEERAQAARTGLGYISRVITHIGSQRWSGDYPPRIVEGNGQLIYLGCRACLDASPTVLYVAAVTEHGAWGLWRNYQTGISRAVDSAGNPLSDPAGYFCAIRIPPVQQ